VDGHLVWVSPPWKPKKGISLAHITEVGRPHNPGSALGKTMWLDCGLWGTCRCIGAVS
jgi:hypothetical protein